MIAAWLVKIILMVAIASGAQTAHWDVIDGHPDCTAILGDTSVVFCADGFITTS
jgi:hypothetical protein